MDISNKVFLGDCRDILKQFPPDSVTACITDPPYNYEFIGHKWNPAEVERRLSRVKNSSTLVKNIPYGSGLAGGVRNDGWYRRIARNIQEYQQWCYEWAAEVYRVCRPGATVAAFNSTRTVAHVQIAMERAGFYSRDIIVYRRNGGIPRGLNAEAKLRKLGSVEADTWRGWHSCLRNEWEAIVVVQKPLIGSYIETALKHGTGLFKAVSDDGIFQSNILEKIPRDHKTESSAHCTAKPLALMERLVEMFVPPLPGSLVLDPFAGSGTTLLAAANLGRDYAGIEIVPEYINVINERLSAASDLHRRREQPCARDLWSGGSP